MLITTLAALVIAAQPPSIACRPALEITGRNVLGPTGSDLGQVRLTLTARPGCPTQLVRVKTRNSAIVPPLGYWRIGGGARLRGTNNFYIRRDTGQLLEFIGTPVSG